jgi:hypothetical protein
MSIPTSQSKSLPQLSKMDFSKSDISTSPSPTQHTPEKMDKKSSNNNTLPKMLSTIAKDTLPHTLCDETLAELKRQTQSKIYTERVNVFWSPDLEVAEMKQKLKLFSQVDIRDFRNRPSSHISKTTKLPYTQEEIKELKDASEERLNALRKIIWNKETTPQDKINARHEDAREQRQNSWYSSLSRRLEDWKPARQVVVWLNLNHHKKEKYEEIAGKYPDDVFVQQIWSCIRQRCSLMDEANKGRKNPMRNIGIELTFTPGQTYFVTSWDIDRCGDDEYGDSEIVTYRTNCSEYRLEPDGQVVQFKSEVTMNIELKQRQDVERKAEEKRKEAEEKQKKKDEELASLTHHRDEWGHPYSQKDKKKNTAVYDDIWVLDPPSALRDEWTNRVAVLTMEGRAYVDIFIGRRVVDTSTHSLFSCVGFKYYYYVRTETTGLMNKVEKISYFTEPLTMQVNKGKTGKYKDNKTKQLRVIEKVDLKDLPKV